MKRKHIIILASILFVFFLARTIYVGYPLLFPASPESRMEKHLAVLKGNDLAAIKESMDDIRKLSYELKPCPVALQDAVAKAIDDRYQATIGAKRKFGEYDFSIMLNGMFALENMTPYSKATQDILLKIGNNTGGKEIEYSFGKIADMARDAAFAGLIQQVEDAEKKIEETKKKVKSAPDK